MEYLIFLGLVIVFVAAVIGKDIYNDRKKKKRFEQDLRKNYGVLRERKLNLERFARMDRYYQKHQEQDQIDDITWNICTICCVALVRMPIP